MQVDPLCKTTVESFLSPLLLCTALKCKWLLWILSMIQNNQRTPLCLLQIHRIYREASLARVFRSDLARKITLRTFDSKYKLDHTKLQEPCLQTSALTTYTGSQHQCFFPFSVSSIPQPAQENQVHEQRTSKSLTLQEGICWFETFTCYLK